MQDEPHSPDDADDGGEPSALDRAVVDLLRVDPQHRAARLAELERVGDGLADGVRRRLRMLTEYGLLEVPGEPAAAPPLPDSIGGYRILRVLGSGGMGVVYLAEHHELRRQVALKVLHGWRLGSDRARERFRREALLAARLDHPGLCPVLDCGEADRVPFLAMRYVPGEPLDRLIESARAAGRSVVALPPAGASGTDGGDERANVLAAVDLVARVARAIDAAHRHGLVHRDLKPGNIVVEPDGAPVVLDFGLARDESEGGLTLSGDHVGTPAYMAPEQVGAPGLRVDARTDVYALGVVLYECLTLELPCLAADRETLYRATLRGSAAGTVRRQRRLDRDLRVVLATAMDPDPRRRYATALLLAQDLERYRRREPILARPANAVLRLRRWMQRNPALAVAVVLLAVGLLATSVLAYERGVSLRHARSVQLAHESRELQPRNALRAHLLALAGVEADRNLETISQLHATTVAVHEHAQLDHVGILRSCCWSPDGSRLLTSSEDGCARLWTSTGELVAVLRHTEAEDQGRSLGFLEGLPVPVALFLGDGRIVTADGVGVARLWSGDGDPLGVLYEDRSRRGFYDGTVHRQSGLVLLVGADGLAVCWRDVQGTRTDLGIERRTQCLLATCAVAADGRRFGCAVNFRPRHVPGADHVAFVWRLAEPEPTELRGHEASIVAMAFRDGDVLTASLDGTVRCWDERGAQKWSCPHPTRVVALAVAPDGGTFATADADGDLWVWDADGKNRTRLYRHHSQCQSVAWAPDGGRLLVGANDGMAVLLDRDGRVRERLSGHADFLNAAEWSPDGRHLVTGGMDRTARLWRADARLPVLHGHRGAVRCLSLAPDGERLLSGSADGTARVWALDGDAPARELAVIPSGEPSNLAVVVNVAWHPRDANEVLLCTFGQVAQRVDVATGERRWRHSLGTGFRSLDGAYTPDGRRLLLGGRHGAPKHPDGVTQVDLRDGSLGALRIAASNEITALAVDGVRGRLAAAEWYGRLVLADLGGHVLAELDLGAQRANGVAFAPGGELLLAGCHDGSVRLWDVRGERPELVWRQRGHAAGVTSVAWSRDGERFASSSLDATARIWERTGKAVAILRANERVVWDVVFSADGRRLFTAGDDGAIRRWFVDDEELLAAARRLAFRPFSALELEQYANRVR